MCGIVGISRTSGPIDTEGFDNISSLLSHRGPDAQGSFHHENTWLGFMRLSIIDLSENANQPMHSHSGRYAVIHNGEIYNFKEVRKELEGGQGGFKTQSDTEVLLESFEKWGTAAISKWNGMFATAVYDKEKKVLYLIRDRMGIKPLYYYWDGEFLAFASEIKALIGFKQVKNKLTIRKEAISEFLHLGYIPEPNSIYQNIYKLAAGAYLKLEDGNVQIEKYWTLEDQIDKVTVSNEQDAKEQFNVLLKSAVEYRMISDVPLGTFLSGGIDSSLVTSVAQQLSSVPIKTFTIGFKEEKYNEANYAKQVAKYLGTDHHEYMLSYKEGIDLIEDLTNVYDEPFADSSAIPTMLVSKFAKEHVAVTLSGDGGDELFFGYGSYRWAKRLANPFVRMLRKPTASMFSMMSDKYKRAAYMLRYPDVKKLKSHVFSQEQYFFTEPELSGILTEPYQSLPVLNEDFSGLKRALNFTESQALFDLKYYLKDDLLTKVDRASMKYSLEVRVPLLDHNIVQFALNLPYKLKFKNGQLKYFLKQVCYDHIPEKLFDRPKQGFSIPLNVWLKKELNFLIEDHLSEKALKQYDLLNVDSVRLLLSRYRNGEDYLYQRVWLLIVLQKFMAHNI